VPLHEPKHLPDKARARPHDAGRLAGLAQVLAREAGDNERNPLRESLERAHVIMKRDSRKLVPKDGHGARLVFAQKNSLMSSPVEAALKSADSCEQAGNLVAYA